MLRWPAMVAVLCGTASSTIVRAEPDRPPRRDPRLLTIDEAVDLSQRTGRPIFAVAGSST